MAFDSPSCCYPVPIQSILNTASRAILWKLRLDHLTPLLREIPHNDLHGPSQLFPNFISQYIPLLQLQRSSYPLLQSTRHMAICDEFTFAVLPGIFFLQIAALPVSSFWHVAPGSPFHELSLVILSHHLTILNPLFCVSFSLSTYHYCNIVCFIYFLHYLSSPWK